MGLPNNLASKIKIRIDGIMVGKHPQTDRHQQRSKNKENKENKEQETDISTYIRMSNPPNHLVIAHAGCWGLYPPYKYKTLSIIKQSIFGHVSSCKRDRLGHAHIGVKL
jgi:hypothetical protein